MFGMNVVGQNGRFLTAKYIEVAPYSWLEKLEKIGKKITLEIERVFKVIYKKMPKIGFIFLLVGKEGLEPSRPCGQQILSLSRLPVPPFALPLIITQKSQKHQILWYD